MEGYCFAKQIFCFGSQPYLPEFLRGGMFFSLRTASWKWNSGNYFKSFKMESQQKLGFWLIAAKNLVRSIAGCVILKGLCFCALYSAVYMSKNDKEKRFSRLHCQGCWQPAKHTVSKYSTCLTVFRATFPFPAKQKKRRLLKSAACSHTCLSYACFSFIQNICASASRRLNLYIAYKLEIRAC